jgi:cytochrome c551/c552
MADLRHRCFAALALLATIGTLSSSLAVAGFGDPTKGQSLFVSKGCVECHAVRGAGGRVGPDLGRTAVKGSFYEISAAMWNHSSTMGEKMAELRLVRPTFRESELADLLAFLYFLNYFDEPGDPNVGKVLFAQKHCIQCHSLGRIGGVSGPRLDTLPRGTSPLRIAQDLWNHGPAMIPAVRRMGLEIRASGAPRGSSARPGTRSGVAIFSRRRAARAATRSWTWAGASGRTSVRPSCAEA